MAFNVFSVLPLLLLLSITPLYSSFSPSDGVNERSLDQICSQPPIDKHFCVTWLLAYPQTFSLDMKGLLGLVLDRIEFMGAINQVAMKILARDTTDPSQKIPYESCIEFYESAIFAITAAEGMASSNAYQLASHAVSKALYNLSLCEALLKGHDYVPADVPHFNAMFKRRCIVGLVFSNVLTS